MAGPSIAANAALNAYTAAAKLANQGTSIKPAEPSAIPVRPDFGSLVAEAATDLVANGRAAEDKSMAMLQGKANVVDVVTAVAETEVALETMVSVRDRVIAAYEQIMRMPI